MGWPATTTPITITTELVRVASQLSLVREIGCGDEAVAVHVCWSRDHDDPDLADLTFEALASLSANFAYWSTGAMALGADWLAPRIEEVVAERLKEVTAEREALALAEAKERREAEEERAYEAAIHAFFKEKRGWYHVEFRKGRADAPFWTIRFEEGWERDRFWDWMAWQLDRFEELAAFLIDNDPLDLERRLLREMLVTEQAVKKQGLGAGGRRPLRFWRGEL